MPESLAAASEATRTTSQDTPRTEASAPVAPPRVIPTPMLHRKPPTSAVPPQWIARAEWGGPELIEQIAGEWRELCAPTAGEVSENAYNLPFFRPEWIAAAVRAFFPGQRVLLITLRRQGRLQAVLPLVEEKRRAWSLPIRRLRSAASVEHSCRFDLIYATDATSEIARDVAGEARKEVAREIWRCLSNLREWDAIELTNVPQGAALEQVLSIAKQEACLVTQHELRRSPFIRLQPQDVRCDVAQFARSSKLRANLRRNWRRLERHGPLELQRVTDADPQRLARFYRLERKSWKGRRGTAIACSPATQQFYDSVARAAAKFGYLSLYFLEQSGRTIAARFGLTFGHTYFPLKIASDENYSEYGPGHLVVGASLQDAAGRGITECDWLGRQSDWKLQWTTDARPHYNYAIFRRSLAGRALFWLFTLHQSVSTTIRIVRRPLAAGFRSYRAMWLSRVGARRAKP